MLASPTILGIVMTSGSLEIVDSTIEGAVAAIDAGDATTAVRDRRLVLTNTTLRSPGVVITEATTKMIVTDCALARGTPDPQKAPDGIRMVGGTLELIRTTLRDFDRGIVIEQPADARRADEVARASLDQADIAVGDTAIDVKSNLDGVRLQVRNSHITGQRGGLVLHAGLAEIDLGTTTLPGANEIATAGGPAIDDARSGGAIDAHGTTLNGMTFEGQVQGPASVAGAYALTGSDVIRF
jgi:hypothetical protein